MKRVTWLSLLALVAACTSDPSAPAVDDAQTEDITAALSQPFENTRGAAVDASGIGGVEFPDSLKLTAEQKARIEALHAAFKTANAADLEALKAIERQVRAAVEARKSREEIARILAQAGPILERLSAAMKKLQEDIWNVYTPAQQAWVRGRRDPANSCRADVMKLLTQEQVEKIRALRAAFVESIKAHMETIKKVHEEARAAKQAGKSEAEIRQILKRAEDALAAVAQAERKLKQDILALLTPAQKENACLLRYLFGEAAPSR
jgi:Spy/CpxP family protein refolding chaperone